jgi:maltose alpha-D-glucosyltransferase/alpha-amylase
VVFPSIGELTYLLTLPGHGFYWFQLPPAPPARPTRQTTKPTRQAPR